MTPPLSPPARALLVALRGNGALWLYQQSMINVANELRAAGLVAAFTVPVNGVVEIALTDAGRAWKETTP